MVGGRERNGQREGVISTLSHGPRLRSRGIPSPPSAKLNSKRDSKVLQETAAISNNSRVYKLNNGSSSETTPSQHPPRPPAPAATSSCALHVHRLPPRPPLLVSHLDLLALIPRHPHTPPRLLRDPPTPPRFPNRRIHRLNLGPPLRSRNVGEVGRREDCRKATRVRVGGRDEGGEMGDGAVRRARGAGG